MATSITGKLNKQANVFQAGESTGFGIRLGVKCRNPKTKADEWANYSAVIFAKSPGQIEFYQSALVEGSIVEVSCEALLIDNFAGKDGPVLSLEMINAKLGYVHTGQAPQQQQGYQQVPQQQSYNQPPQQGGFMPQQAPQQQNNGFQQQPPANYNNQR